MKLTRSPRRIVAAVSLLACAGVGSACSRDVQAISPQQVQQQYGISDAYSGSVQTQDGKLEGTIVPVTMGDGTKAQLVLPSHKKGDPDAVYLKDRRGVHPVKVAPAAPREAVVQSPAVVAQAPEPPHPQKRSWEKDALIIGGGAGAGAAVGAIAGGGKGAAIGGAAGGIGGLIYDVVTRNKENNQNRQQ